MKPRLSPFFLLFSLMPVFFGCTTDIVRQPADMAASREEAAPEEEVPAEAVVEKPAFQGPTILGITVTDGLDNQVIDVEADRPLVFTMYKPSDPFQVVVELTAADLGSNTERILVDRDSILDIVPTQVESPSRMARLEIGLTAPLAITPRVEGNHLLLEVPRLAPMVSAEQEEPVSAAEEVAALSEEIAAEEHAPAVEAAEEAEAEVEPEPIEEIPEPEAEVPAAPPVTVKSVSMDSEDDLVNVRIMTDGEVSPEVYAIGGKKIIVDIPGVKHLEKGSVPEVIAPVQRIRTGTYRGKARIVIDLFMESKYEVSSNESGVSVSMPKPPPVKVAAKTEEAAEEVPGMEEMEKIVPATDMAETREITAGTLMQPRKTYSGQKISLDFQDADVVQIYRLLSDVAGYNLVIHPEVKGKIPSLKLENVPWDQALEIVLKLSGQGSVIEGNILRIAPQDVFTRENDALVKAREARQKAEELFQRIIAINYADAGEIRSAIEQSKILSPRGNITIDARMNTLIVQDVQDSIDKILDLVKIMDIAKPQVMIEARMVTVRTTASKDLGIDWTGVFNASAETGVTTGLRFPNDISGTLATNVGLGAVEPTLTLALGSVADIFTLNLQIAALEEGNEGRTLSNPKVMTMDNEEAEVKQGTKIPYKTISDKGTETAFVDATLSLKVTPRITPGGYVQLKILATRNAIGVNTADGPAIDLNEVTTQALVRDGDTIVLGGIYTKDTTGRETKVPVLGDIPLFGWLFKSTTDTEEINELLIFITPRIVKGRVTL